MRMAVLARDGYRCIYCGRRPPECILEVDHVLPRAAGGLDIATNLVTACRDCNGGKSDQPLPLPEGFTPEPIGFQRRAPARLGTAGDPPPFLRWAADSCFACPLEHYPLGCGNVLPVSFIDGDAQSVQLGYRCPCGHQWHCWWSPEYARLHADTIRWQATAGHLIAFPVEPRWLS